MKCCITALAGLLLLFQPSTLSAGEETTLPVEIENQLVKGKWLAHVWRDPGFDGEKGFTLGGISVDTVDEIGEVKETLAEAMGSFAKSGAPYQLHASIRRVQVDRKAGAGVSVSVLGIVREATGKVVAAFETTESSVVGGNDWNNRRLATRRIAYALSRELFPVAPKLPQNAAPAARTPLAGGSLTAAAGKPAAGATAVSPGIPPATLPLTKGQTLDRVWKDPAFDRTVGFQLGGITVDTEDAAQDAKETLPEALRIYLNPESPYSLYLSILKVKSNSRGETSASVNLGGTLRDAQGRVMAAFETSGSSSIGGGVWNNTRLAVRMAIHNAYKELFPSLLKVDEKAPEIIVSAKGTGTARVVQDRSVLVPGKPAGAGATAVPAKESLPPLFSKEIGSQMKRGKALGKLWVSPSYEKSSGFTLGEVRYVVEARNDGIDKTFPDELKKIAQTEAPFSLQLRIILLAVRVQKSTNVTLRVQGNLTAADGTVVAAFETQEMVSGSTDSGIAECRTAALNVVHAIAKDLNP